MSDKPMRCPFCGHVYEAADMEQCADCGEVVCPECMGEFDGEVVCSRCYGRRWERENDPPRAPYREPYVRRVADARRELRDAIGKVE